LNQALKGFFRLFLVMNDCIFCKIVKGEVPSVKVFEGSIMVAFLDIQPLTPGHALIVPKRHMEDLEDLTAEEWIEVARLANRVGNAAKKGLNATSFMLVRHGELVNHTHFHVVPRYPNDRLTNWTGVKTPFDELEKNAQKIKKFL
jgi:histidine triad (HIT) family protein